MEPVSIWLSRCVALFRRHKLDEDLDAELCSHIEFACEENMKRGMSEQEARTRALREFGGLTQTKEAYRVQQGLPFLERFSSMCITHCGSYVSRRRLQPLRFRL